MFRFSTLLLATIPSISSAATLSVGPTQPYVTISDALLAAADGDTIEVDAGDYAEVLDVSIDVDIVGLDGLGNTTLSGIGAAAVTINGTTASLSGFTLNPSADRGIVLANGATFAGTDLDVSGFVLGPNEDGAALVADSSMVTLVDVILDSNESGRDGGTAALFDSVGVFTRITVTNSFTAFDGAVGVYNSDLFVEDSTFSDNVSDDDGGAFDIDQGSGVTITTSTFTNNSAVDAGGAITAQNSSDLALIDCVFEGNVASEGPGSPSSGGAVRIRIDANLTATGTDFTGNSAEANGGAIRLDGGDHTFGGNTFGGNVCVDGFGGAIAMDGGADVTIDGDTFDNHSASFGGALYSTDDGDLLVTNSIFTANQSVERGGAIRWLPDGAGASLSIAFSSFDANASGTTGGAIAISDFGGGGGAPFISINNTFTGNASAEAGGAVYVQNLENVYAEANIFCANVSVLEGGAAFVDNGGASTNGWFGNLFVDNQSADLGGGLAFDSASTSTLVNNTFAGNSGGIGGHVGAVTTDVNLVNNIFVDAPAGDGVQQSNTAGFRDYNLWLNNTNNDVGGALNAGDLGNNSIFADPAFLAYSADGDCSNDDFHLDPASPAVDAGEPGILDRDGSPSDMGAFGGPNAIPSDNDGDGFNDLQDCDDGDAAVNPNAAEICDGIDNNCDGDTDLASAGGAVPWYTDGDGDGFGDINSEVLACYDPGNMIQTGGDCDDADLAINPGATEICDDIDQDCDDIVDDGVQTAWYADSDADGFGGGHILLFDCFGGSGLVASGDDCDDDDPNVNPSAVESCDDTDNNCDGDVDEGLEEIWYEDADGDGFGVWDSTVMDCDDVDGFSPDAGDCDDSNDTVYPGAEDIEGDLIDQDCDGVADGANDGTAVGRKGEDDGGCGCDSSAGSPGWLPLLGALFAVRRREGASS